MRAFLDANVLVSASLGMNPVARQLWGLADNGLVDLIASDLATLQAERTLATKSPSDLPNLRQLVAQLEVTELAPEPDATWALDYEDGVLLATAIACGAMHFITGDKHFRRLRCRNDLGIRIVTIREFLNLVS